MTKPVLLLSFLALVASCEAPMSSMGGSSSTAVSAFKVGGSWGARFGTVDNVAHTLTAIVPSGTNLVNDVLPLITHGGASLSPADNFFTNFSQPVVYTITAVDGTHQQYTATVTREAAPKAMTAFSFDGLEDAIGTINENLRTVAVTVPKNTDVTALAPTITITGASVNPASGAARDFSQPVLYTVTGSDGLTRVYTVTVTADTLANTKDITAFTFSNGPGLMVVGILGTDIGVGLPAGTNVTGLIPVITHNGVSVTPATGVPTNFTNPVNFTIHAENGSTKVYTVTVTAN